MAESNQIPGLASGKNVSCGVYIAYPRATNTNLTVGIQTTNCVVPPIVDSPCETIAYLVTLLQVI